AKHAPALRVEEHSLLGEGAKRRALIRVTADEPLPVEAGGGGGAKSREALLALLGKDRIARAGQDEQAVESPAGHAGVHHGLAETTRADEGEIVVPIAVGDPDQAVRADADPGENPFDGAADMLPDGGGFPLPKRQVLVEEIAGARLQNHLGAGEHKPDFVVAFQAVPGAGVRVGDPAKIVAMRDV